MFDFRCMKPLNRSSVLLALIAGLAAMGGERAAAVPPGVPKIVWRSYASGTHSIWMMNPDGSDRIQLTDNQGHDLTPCLSRDGSEIAFASDRDGAPDKLFLMSCDGTNLRAIAAAPGLNVHYPSWSPDGQRILFSASIGASSGGLFIVDRDGTNLEQLTGGFCCRPFFTPDGSEIVFDRRTSSLSYSNQLFRMNADGSNVQQCTIGDPPGESTTTSCGGVTPDGSTIVYSRGHGLWVADATCPISGETLLYPGSNPDNLWEDPSWSPDGEWIVFDHRPPGGDDNIYICRADGSELTQLTFDPGSDKNARWGIVGDPWMPCLADVNGDGMVDVIDLLHVLAEWGQSGVPEDINADGVVNVLDILEVLAQWGPCA